MGGIPNFLYRQLGRDVVLERYRSWGLYDPPTRMRVLVDEGINSGVGQAGVQVYSVITLRMPLNTDLPTGTKVTLPDGRKGYVSAISRRDGGSLPVPSHLEAVVSTGNAYGPPFGETVLLKHVTGTYEDRYHNTRFTFADVLVDGCAVRLLTAGEQATATSDLAVDTVEVIMPPGTAVGAQDRMVLRGLTYEVDGTPQPLTSSMATGQAGVRVIGKRHF